MRDTIEPEPLEVNLQERASKKPADHSLPAGQVIEEFTNEAGQNFTPRFIP